jgi:hypothetical protein
VSAIFISYRRDDSLSATGRLADQLSARFGADEVFRDVEDMQAGSDFRLSLVDALRTARVVVAVVGRSWFGLRSDGSRRIDDAGDYVHQEIEMALTQDVQIVPVLVEGARMPNPDELPVSIRALAYRQALELSESRWAYDTERLIDRLAQTARLEPAPAAGGVTSGSGSPTSSLLRMLAQLPADFLHLLVEPVRFLIERGLAERGALFRALAFLFVSQLMAGTLVLQEWPTESSILQFLLTPVILVQLATVIVSLPLYGAWRLVGAPREYGRVLVIVLYQAAFVGLGLSVSILVSLIGLNMSSPATVAALARGPTFEGLITSVKTLESSPASAPQVVAAMMSSFVLVVLLIWLLVTWRAYEVVLHQTRARSLAALALFVLICFVPVGLLTWVGLIVEGS